MYTLDELKTQNQDIAELIAVLSVLIEHENLRTNPYVCELLNRFREKVWMHLVFEDNTIYAALIQNTDPDVQNTITQFRNSAKEIKKRFSRYIRHWCGREVEGSEAIDFIGESRAIFQMVMERVNYENEHMLPRAAKH